jgi:hypothetical protein
MVVVFSTNYAISAYLHQRCEFKSRSGKVYHGTVDGKIGKAMGTGEGSDGTS